jgi:uncharacterized protein (TIGR02300 family)
MAGKGHPLAKSALGTKRICTGCAAKFYDLGKDPIVCPTCDTVYVIAPPAPVRGGRHGATPRSVYDPKAQTANAMGTLKEADAPGVADDAEDKEDAEEGAEVAGIEDEADDTEEAGGVPMLEELDEK